MPLLAIFLMVVLVARERWVQETSNERTYGPKASLSFPNMEVLVSIDDENVTKAFVNVESQVNPFGWFTIEADALTDNLRRADVTSWRGPAENKSVSLFFRGEEKNIEAVQMALFAGDNRKSFYDLNFDGVWDYHTEILTLASGEEQVKEFMMLDQHWIPSSGNCIPMEGTPKLVCDGVSYIFSEGRWRPSSGDGVNQPKEK